jgi:hypothetical protein
MPIEIRYGQEAEELLACAMADCCEHAKDGVFSAHIQADSQGLISLDVVCQACHKVRQEARIRHLEENAEYTDSYYGVGNCFSRETRIQAERIREGRG